MKTKKITQTSLLLASLVLATLVPVTAFAADDQSSDTDVSVTVVGGGLSAADFSDVSFPNISVKEAWDGNYSGNAEMSAPTAKDYQGLENPDWTIKVSASGWAEGAEGSKTGADVLNSNKVHFSIDTAGKSEFLNGKGIFDAYKGKAGEYSASGAGDYLLKSAKFNLAIDKGTDVKAGSYTNTLTWSIANTVAADGK